MLRHQPKVPMAVTALIWLNRGGFYRDAPKDLYSCNGFQGQMIFIIPSMDLIIVRMGLKEDPGFDFNNFLKEVTESFKKTKPNV